MVFGSESRRRGQSGERSKLVYIVMPACGGAAIAYVHVQPILTSICIVYEEGRRGSEWQREKAFKNPYRKLCVYCEMCMCVEDKRTVSSVSIPLLEIYINVTPLSLKKVATNHRRKSP